MKPRRFANVALVAISLGLAYLLLELVLFPAVLPHLPLLHHSYLGRMGILAQTSKSGTVPVDYIALAGDSHAQGKGDWLGEVARKGNGPFHSAHVLHQLSGRDVVSFGRGGAGSLEGFAGEPIAQFRHIDGSPWYALEPPRLIIAYVYEGNDFNNNIRAIGKAMLGSRGATDDVDAAKLERYVAEWSEKWSSDPGTAVAPVLMYAFNAVVGTYDTIAKREAKEIKKKEKWQKNRRRRPDESAGKEIEKPTPTVALVAGERVALPDWLQAPAMRMSRPEIDAAVLMLRTSLVALHRDFPSSELIVT